MPERQLSPQQACNRALDAVYELDKSLVSERERIKGWFGRRRKQQITGAIRELQVLRNMIRISFAMGGERR